jgi:hypothetical protein
MIVKLQLLQERVEYIVAEFGDNVKVGEPNEKGENDIVRNILNIDFIDGKMTHSPNWMAKQIRNDINSMFGLYINTYGASWGMEVKMVRD